jgi:hypothetical protein
MGNKVPVKILSPCGILGYGFPDASFQAGLADSPDAIVVDAGSTDAGPHKLGAGHPIVSRMAAKKDLKRIICGGVSLNIPVIIGSAGGSGGRVHLEWTLSIIEEIWREEKLSPMKTMIIRADIPKDLILANLEAGTIRGLGDTVPGLTPESLARTNAVVAQMGAEPIMDALDAGARLVICGRAYDPA